MGGGGRLNNMQVVFLGMVLVVASLLRLHTSNAQTTHVVGDASGWTIPSGTNNYTTWASQQNFTVGDVLVFNFATNVHDVAEVTQASLGSCSSTTPISLSTVSPTNITLNSTGGHYFICTFPGHCDAGQRLTINVAAASTPSPAPQPATPPPPSSTTPTPSPVSPPPSSPTPAPVSPPPSSPTPSPVSPPPSSPTPSPGSQPPSSPTPTPSSAPAPSSTPTPSPASGTPPSPGTTTTPSPDGSTTSPPPPPPSSATSVAVTALPLTLLTVALAFLY